MAENVAAIAVADMQANQRPASHSAAIVLFDCCRDMGQWAQGLIKVTRFGKISDAIIHASIQNDSWSIDVRPDRITVTD